MGTQKPWKPKKSIGKTSCDVIFRMGGMPIVEERRKNPEMEGVVPPPPS